MNILHISRTMGQGGAEKIVYQLCKNNMGNCQIVASCGGEYIEDLIRNNVIHYTISDIDKKNPFIIVKTFLILNKIINKENVDIIHTHHRMAAFYARLLIALHKNVKHIYTAHNIFKGKKFLMRFALGHACIVSVGMDVKNNLIEEYGIDENRIRLIYNAVDTRVNRDYKNEVLEKFNKENKYVIGTIGRLSEQKGIDIFIKAIKLVGQKKNNLVGVIIGDGEDREKLCELVSQLNLEDKIYFLGYQNNILELIRQLQFIVLASRWEGFPLIPIETFSQKKTIIVTDIPGNNEIVHDMKNGLIFVKDNVEELAKKMIFLIENKNIKRKLEEEAESDFKEKYSYEKFIKSYYGLYYNCVNDMNY